MVVSLPLSRFGMSVAQFILLGSWLLQGGLKRKLHLLGSSFPAIVLISFFMIHVAGLIHTTDFHYGFKDIRTKLPLLLFPVVFATSGKLSGRKAMHIWWLYLGAVLAGTLVTSVIILSGDLADTREAFPFISHIRFSLHVCFAFFVAFYVRKKLQGSPAGYRHLFSLLMGWFVFFLFLSNSLTGLIILGILLFFFAVRKIFTLTDLYGRLGALLALIIFLTFSFFYLHDIVKSYKTPFLNSQNNPDMFTEKGNPYTHDTIGQPVESGSYIGMYVCDKELREAWNSRSELDYDGRDNKGQRLKETLIRYLNSKDLRKDAEGISRLDSNDIRAVEDGTANSVYLKKFSFRSRLYQLLWEYDSYIRGGNPGGHTLMQRIEFWRAAAGIIKQNFWWGVGTGDVQQAFDEQYEKMDSRLEMQYRWRAHNQYLAVFVGLGIFGILWFLYSLLYPGIRLRKSVICLYPVFLSIIMLSMLTEDTLETQAGVSLYAFFNSWLLFGLVNDKKSGDG